MTEDKELKRLKRIELFWKIMLVILVILFEILIFGAGVLVGGNKHLATMIILSDGLTGFVFGVITFILGEKF